MPKSSARAEAEFDAIVRRFNFLITLRKFDEALDRAARVADTRIGFTCLDCVRSLDSPQIDTPFGFESGRAAAEFRKDRSVAAMSQAAQMAVRQLFKSPLTRAGLSAAEKAGIGEKIIEFGIGAPGESGVQPGDIVVTFSFETRPPKRGQMGRQIRQILRPVANDDGTFDFEIHND